jgi:ankyrin repeat protein
MNEFRSLRALVPHLMQGLHMPNESEFSPASVDEFLHVFCFETADDTSGSGFSPLTAAAISGNTHVARELIRIHKADVNVPTTALDTTHGLDKGSTPLIGAAAFCPPEHVDEMVALLLGAGANPNHGSKTGTTPLHVAVACHNLAGVEALITRAKGPLNLVLEAGDKIANGTPLNIAAYLSTPEIVRKLIDAGAHVGHIDDHGGHILSAAACNPAMTTEMLEQLIDGADCNRVQRPLTFKWHLIFAILKMLLKRNLIGKSDLFMGLAHSRGSTALHIAAMNGCASLVACLLDNGAHKSLTVRNQMGCTPMDVARLFGPHPEVEARLGLALLEQMEPRDPAIGTAAGVATLAAKESAPEVSMQESCADMEC